MSEYEIPQVPSEAPSAPALALLSSADAPEKLPTALCSGCYLYRGHGFARHAN